MISQSDLDKLILTDDPIAAVTAIRTFKEPTP
jgi:hypothetical protein